MSKKDALLVGFAIICGLIMFGFLVKHIETEQEARKEKELLADTLSSEAQYWHGRVQTDAMTDEKTYEIYIKSADKPSSPSELDLTIERKGKDTRVFLSLDTSIKNAELSDVEGREMKGQEDLPTDKMRLRFKVRADRKPMKNFLMSKYPARLMGNEVENGDEFVNYVKDADTIRIQVGLGGINKRMFMFCPKKHLPYPPRESDFKKEWVII